MCAVLCPTFQAKLPRNLTFNDLFKNQGTRRKYGNDFTGRPLTADATCMHINT